LLYVAILTTERVEHSLALAMLMIKRRSQTWLLLHAAKIRLFPPVPVSCSSGRVHKRRSIKLPVGLIGAERALNGQSALSIDGYPCKYILRFRASVSKSGLGAEKAVVSEMAGQIRVDESKVRDLRARK